LNEQNDIRLNNFIPIAHTSQISSNNNQWCSAPYVILFIQAQTNNVTFQQDNARPHVARVVRDYLTQQNVDLLPWPAVSPDLSPIEHVGVKWNDGYAICVCVYHLH
jgi:hypothetical protein